MAVDFNVDKLLKQVNKKKENLEKMVDDAIKEKQQRLDEGGVPEDKRVV